jgi:hypothetical protein
VTRRQVLSASLAGAVAGFPLHPVAGCEVDPWELVRRQFPIDDDLIYLNTGTYGPSSREVAAAECRGREALNRDFNHYFYDRFIDERIRDRFWPTVVEGREGWDTADRFGRDPGEPSIDFAPAWPPTMIKYATNLLYYGPLFWALQAAMDLQESIGRGTVEARTHALTQRVRDGLAGIDGARILSPESLALRSAITSFTVDGFEANALRQELKARRIVTRYVDHRPFEFEANRVCTHVFNTEGQVDQLLEAVESIAKKNRGGARRGAER